MTRDEALAELRKLGRTDERRDVEVDHSRADDVLLELIGDPEITEAFNAIQKWYA